MRSSKSRSRNKQRNRSVGNIVNRVFDSSGPEGKVRGTPQQIIDKYNQLARDAQLAGDRVATENFQQHAEHYTRMLAEAQREQNERREQQEAQQRERQQQRSDDQQPPRRGDGDDGQPQPQAEETKSTDPNPAQETRNDPGSAPQPDTPPAGAEAEAKPAKPRRSRSSAPRGKQAPAQERADDVIDFGADEDKDTGLVETPEEKPKRKPRARKPKAAADEKKADEKKADEGGDTSQNDATAAE